MKKTKKLLAALSIAAVAVTVSAGCSGINAQASAAIVNPSVMPKIVSIIAQQDGYSKVLVKYDGKTVQGYVKKEYIGMFQ